MGLGLICILIHLMHLRTSHRLRRRLRQVYAFVLDHFEELDRLIGRHVFHVLVQLAHELGCLLFTEGVVAGRCERYQPILSHLNLRLMPVN